MRPPVARRAADTHGRGILDDGSEAAAAHSRIVSGRVWTSIRGPAQNRASVCEGFQIVNPGFEEVMSVRGRGMPAPGEVSITGHDPVFSARFRIGETTANILAGIGIAVTDIHEMKTGRRQKLSID